MTELVPQAQASALDGAADLESVLKAIVARKPGSAPEKPSKPAKMVEVKKETRDAISRLNDRLSSTKLPSERRRLTQEELVDLEGLGTDAKLVEKGVVNAVSAVKQAVFNHFDLGLEENNGPEQLAEFLDPKTGHYLVSGEQEIPGTGKKFVRQLAQGGPSIAAADLKKLWDEGVISRAMYYKLTQKVEVPRELNEEALLDELKKDPKLQEKIAPAIKPGKVVPSFWIRDVEEN